MEPRTSSSCCWRRGRRSAVLREKIFIDPLKIFQVDSTGMYSWTPLLVAVRGNHPGVVALLLHHGKQGIVK